MANYRKACKQCGGKAVLRKAGGSKTGWFYIRCKDYNCFSNYGGGVSGLTFYPTIVAAEEAWNTRQDA